MKQIKVKLYGEGTENSPLSVNLPTYSIIEIFPNKSALVEIPDDEIDEKTGILDKNKIRHKYRGQTKWDRIDVTDDIIYVE